MYGLEYSFKAQAPAGKPVEDRKDQLCQDKAGGHGTDKYSYGADILYPNKGDVEND